MEDQISMEDREALIHLIADKLDVDLHAGCESCEQKALKIAAEIVQLIFPLP